MLFALLAGYVYLYQPRPKTRQEEMLTKVFSFRSDDVQKVDLQRGTDKIIAERRNGRWVLLHPEKPIPGSTERLQGFIEELRGTVRIDDVGKVGNERSREFGLNDPSGIISIFLKTSPKPLILVLGGANPVRTRVYARFDGSDEVFQLGSLIDFEMGQLFAQITSSTRSHRPLP
jgi:hypothetical protein